jgi:endoglucanase
MRAFTVRCFSGSVLILLLAVLGPLAPATQAASTRGLDPSTQFFAPGLQAEPAAIQQIAGLVRQRQFDNAARIFSMERQPRAVWFSNGGTPASIRLDARKVVEQARLQGQVPVVVLYNIPGRDCGGLSAGGAQNLADYEAWVTGVAQGIGDARAVVILEPDSLGLLPSNCGAGFPFTDADRFAELNFGVDRLEQQPQTLVYLDGTHSHWLAVGDISSRLVQAGVQRAQGFFVNVSNFRAVPDLDKYGTWISECIAFGNDPEEGGWRLGHYDFCASQYFSPFGPVNPDDFSTWHFVDDWYTANMGHAAATSHFVVDTSRNGQGPWLAAGGQPQPGAILDWCNPPGRGLGLRSTATTGVPLLDAYLWVKTPGESDGTCARNRAAAGSPDPEWANIVDPAAGKWFPQQALQLAQLANPPLSLNADRRTLEAVGATP